MVLTGFHHLTAITADAPGNHRFYTQVLGMRLVKRTVNQDDVSAYHLFYADGLASPGSDVTFFDWPAARERRGTGSVVRTGLRVPGRDALDWWGDRLAASGVAHRGIVERDGRLVLDFEDPEGQRLSLVADPGTSPHHPWPASPVPRDYQVIGLGSIALSTARFVATDAVLRDVLGMERVRSYRDGDAEAHVYAMDGGGETAKELHLLDEPGKPLAGQGAGGVHHVALRTPDEETYRGWVERLAESRVSSSGPIDRFYFRSLYFREPGGVLFEIATDGPGFAKYGLRSEIGGILAAQGATTTYAEMVERAQAVATRLNLDKPAPKQTNTSGKRRRDEHDEENETQSEKKLKVMEGVNSEATQTKPFCSQCGKHHNGKCHVGQNYCYWCHKEGHKAYECPTNPHIKLGRGVNATRNLGNVGNNVRGNARAFAMNGDK